MNTLLIVLLIWFGFGIYTAYRTLVYGFLSKQSTIDGDDFFVVFILYPLSGPVAFFASIGHGAEFTLGWKKKVFPIRNPFYKEGEEK